MRVVAGVVAAIALAASPGAAGLPPWKVLAFGNVEGNACAYAGAFVARSAAEAARGVACLPVALDGVVRSVDYRRYVVVGAFQEFRERDWLIEIAGAWRPRGMIAVDARVIERNERAHPSPTVTAYELVRFPRSAFRGPIP